MFLVAVSTLREKREKLLLGAFFNQGVLGNGLLELRIGDDDLACVRVNGGDAHLTEGGGNDAAGEDLAIARDEVGDARGEFMESRQAAQDLIERVELLVDSVDQG